MASPDYRLTREEVCALEENFRLMTHKIANWLTVVKALAKLSEGESKGYEKLITMKLMQCPSLVFQVQSFADEMYKRINPLIPLEIPISAEQSEEARARVA